jgi:small subunit ribosomal protein S16
MLRIRLARVGKKKQPHYRVVVADVEAKRDGRIVERIGYYAPLAEPADFEISEDRALYWLSVGAQPTDAVRGLLRKQGTLARLARLRSGESFEALVAEYTGEAVATVAVPATAEATEEEEVEEEAVVEEIVAEATEAAESLADAVVEVAEDLVSEEE